MWRAPVALACAYGVASANVELSEVGDIEEIPLEDLLERPVVSASRYAQKPASTPTLVSAIDADQIAAFNYRTMGEVLRGMRGIYLTNDRNYSYLGTRGFAVPGDYNTRFAVAIDGHRMNDPVYGQGLVGLEAGLPLIAIDRIELVRGGAWSVYGQSALLGAINIVTATGASRPGLHVRAGASATAETHTDPSNRAAIAPRTQDVSASYGLARPNLDVFAAASYQTDPGLSRMYMPELASDELTCVDRERAQIPCDGIVRGGDKEEVASAYLGVRWHELTVRALASSRRKQVPTAPFATTVGDPTDTTDDRFYADIGYAHAGKIGDIEARFSLDHFRYQGNYPYADAREGYEALPESRILNDDGATATWFTAEVRGRRKWKRIGKHLKDIEIAAGVETQQQQGAQHSIDRYPEGPVTYLDRMDTARMGALTMHGSARAFEHLVGFAAIRGDYYPDGFGSTVNPQAGFVLDLDAGTRLRGTLARGFRAPNLYEANWVAFAGIDDQLSAKGALGPEHSETREVSLERYLGKHARALAVVFSQEISDLVAIETLANGSQRFVNEGTASSTGFELELEARWPALQLRASYAFAHAEGDDGKPLVNSPSSLAVGTALVPIGKRGLFALETNYIGKRLTLDGSSIDPVVLTSTSFTLHEIAEGIDLALGVRNLFDTRMADPGSADHVQTRIPGEPRTVWLSLTARVGAQP